MKRFSFFLLFLFSLCTGEAQNLVVDPSFENFSTCPLGPGSFTCLNWTQPYPMGPGCSTADYYNACSTPGFAGVPSNFLGNENALTGAGYVGIMMYVADPSGPCLGTKGDNYREYVGGSLSSPLIAGQTYSVSFNISLPENVMYATSDIGLYFSNTPVNDPCPAPSVSTVLPYANQLQYTGPAATNLNGWTLIQWSYTAVGGEQYLVIGNFKNDANTAGICSNPLPASNQRFAYYYIDDVSVVLATLPTTLFATATPTHLLCNNQCIGTASVTPANGTAPYTYLWNNGQTANVATGLCAGNYSVLVTDATSTTTTASVTLTQPAALTATTAVTPTACGNNTGTALVHAGGGTAPYTYLWSNGNTGTQISNLAAQVYSLTITDGNGCTQTTTATILNVNGPSVTTTFVNASCSGIPDGTATASASGGTAPYLYLWSNGQTAQTATGLSAGNYSVTVTDAGGCAQTSVATVTNGTGPTASAGPDISIAYGNAATLSASGSGSYSWNTGAGSSVIMVAPSLTTQYCVTVTDANGCSDSACVTVYIIPEPIPCGEFYLPNAFSPNEDNENDVYKAYIDPVCVKEFKLVIYNRWGEKVFETTNVLEGWDGSFRGADSDAAVYAYLCNVTFTSGKKLEKQGNASLVR